ncbi:alkaline phosphatase D family protein, partial [Nocardia carnea]|uniref:alkaline phosphatase D family protein n=1 Tax=Nocardia carnea TaxID=37328 RepID=UPI002457BA2F
PPRPPRPTPPPPRRGGGGGPRAGGRASPPPARGPRPGPPPPPAPDLVVLTGDRHENYVVDIRGDYSDPGSPVVATEFTGTSITTGRDGADLTPRGRTLLAANPDMKFFNGQRGYVRVEVDHQLWRSDFRVVPYVREPGAPVVTRASFVVEHGRPGAESAADPAPSTVLPQVEVSGHEPAIDAGR